jgi:hydroxymethylbilane synthase
MSAVQPIRIATRGSALARWQAARVAALLGGDVELVIVASEGDRRLDVPIHAMGGVGVFTAAIQDAVLAGDADIAVHSAKDLPARTHDGLKLAAAPERADVRDALVGRALDDLPEGATVATGSVRRRAQLASARPDLQFVELRGNIETRIAKSLEIGAGVVAYAALERLGRTDDAAEVMDVDTMLPQVAQGALAVECRADDAAMIERLATIDDAVVHAAITAERAYLALLGGGCTLPCGAWARPDANGALVMDVFLASEDGEIALRASAAQGDGDTPEMLGQALGSAILAQGGDELVALDKQVYG